MGSRSAAAALLLSAPFAFAAPPPSLPSLPSLGPRWETVAALGEATSAALAQSCGRAVAMAAADFDEDGVADLVLGCEQSGGGAVVVLGGDIEARFDVRARGGAWRAPFASVLGVQPLAAPARLLAAGDFDGDGHQDLIATRSGARALEWLRGDGRGGLEAAPPVPLGGPVTALAVGEIDRRDGLADVAVAEGSAGALRLFRSPRGALVAAPERIALGESIHALEFGRFDGSAAWDLAVATESGWTLVGARSAARSALVPPREIKRHALPEGSLAVAELGPTAPVRSPATLPAPPPLGLEPVAPEARPGLAAKRAAGTGAMAAPRFLAPPPVAGGSEARAVLTLRLNGDAFDDHLLLAGEAALPLARISAPLATFTVNSTGDGDDGACDATDCTLREALLAANASVGADLIAFDIQGTPPHVIAVLSDLPTATEAVTVDGATEPDHAGTPVVVLDGSASTGPSGWGLLVQGGASTVRGLAIHGFAVHSGIVLFQGDGNLVEGNFVGTDASGTVALGGGAGIDCAASSGNTIGGTTAAARNVVAGLTLPGLVVREGADDNLLQGNYVGLAASGDVALPDAATDVGIYDSRGNTFGGAAAGARNVVTGGLDPQSVSFGLATGLDADPATQAMDNLVVGNYFGTDASGNVGMGSASAAVYLLDAADNTIGGAVGNVIADSGLFGVALVGPGGTATGNLVSGNRIGIGADGTTPLGHAVDGVRIYLGAAANGVVDNEIAHSGGNGVGLRNDAGSGNEIAGNSIHDNALLGIDLGLDGPTAADDDDADAGPNGLQNAPGLTAVAPGPGTVSGQLESTPETSFTIEVFANPACDDSGTGEGRQPRGTTTAVTGADGQASFALVASAPLVVGEFLSAAATAPDGSTSELSVCLVVPSSIFADGFESSTTSAWSSTVGGS